MRRAVVLVGCLAGCGRLGFEPFIATGDAPVSADATPGIDATACPASYVRVSGLPGYYSALGPNVAWDGAATACAADSVHQFVPANAAEAQAMIDYAFPTALNVVGPSMWVGISDLATEGTFVTEAGAAPPFLPWAVGEPNDSGGEDCGQLIGDLTLNDVACATMLPYVCQCP